MSNVNDLGERWLNLGKKKFKIAKTCKNFEKSSEFCRPLRIFLLNICEIAQVGM